MIITQRSLYLYSSPQMSKRISGRLQTSPWITSEIGKCLSELWNCANNLPFFSCMHKNLSEFCHPAANCSIRMLMTSSDTIQQFCPGTWRNFNSSISCDQDKSLCPALLPYALNSKHTIETHSLQPDSWYCTLLTICCCFLKKYQVSVLKPSYVSYITYDKFFQFYCKFCQSFPLSI